MDTLARDKVMRANIEVVETVVGLLNACLW
jgi:hypothetical protein